VRREFWWGGLMKGDHLEDLGADGNIIFKLIFKKWDGGHGLKSTGSQDRDSWRAVVNVATNFRFK